MNLQVVARFSATTAPNHECRPVIKPLRYPKNEKLPENSQDRVGCEIFYPVSNIFINSSEPCVANAGKLDTGSIQISKFARNFRVRALARSRLEL
jgi:hypothetical protein